MAFLKLIKFKDGTYAVRKGLFKRRYADKHPNSSWWWGKEDLSYYKIRELSTALRVYAQRCTKSTTVRREVL